jgi:hypothetical protein
VTQIVAGPFVYDPTTVEFQDAPLEVFRALRDDHEYLAGLVAERRRRPGG